MLMKFVGVKCICKVADTPFHIQWDDMYISSHTLGLRGQIYNFNPLPASYPYMRYLI